MKKKAKNFNRATSSYWLVVIACWIFSATNVETDWLALRVHVPGKLKYKAKALYPPVDET